MAARKQQKALEQLKRERARRLRAKFPALPKDVEVKASPPGEQKMSEVIVDFLAPYWNRQPPPGEDQMRHLLMLGIIAWNAAIQGGDEGQALVQDTAATMPEDLRDDFLLLIDNLIARKEAHFADIKRFIIDYKLTWDPVNPHIAIISTLA